MHFQESIRTCFSHYADFHGRASRAEYWWFFLFVLLLGLVLSLLSPLLSLVFHLATLLPSLAVGARRLHDTGRSGWWLLIGFIPFGVFVLLYFLAQASRTDSAFDQTTS